jgi:hypothetical protein
LRTPEHQAKAGRIGGFISRHNCWHVRGFSRIGKWYPPKPNPKCRLCAESASKSL